MFDGHGECVSESDRVSGKRDWFHKWFPIEVCQGKRECKIGGCRWRQQEGHYCSWYCCYHSQCFPGYSLWQGGSSSFQIWCSSIQSGYFPSSLSFSIILVHIFKYISWKNLQINLWGGSELLYKIRIWNCSVEKSFMGCGKG